MIVIHKRSNRFRVKLSVNAKYEDAAESLRRLQKQPVGDNITSIMLNKGVIGLAGADGAHVPLVNGIAVEIDSQRATALKNASSVRFGKQSDAGILWELLDDRVVTGAWIIFVEGEHDFRNPGKRLMTERQAEDLVRAAHNN